MNFKFIIAIFLCVSINAYSQTRTFLFVDKSASVDFRPVDMKVKDALKASIKNFSKPKDELYTFLIHSGTAGADPANSCIAPTKPTVTTATEQQVIDIQYNKLLQQNTSAFIKETYNLIMGNGNKKVSGGTDIFGILVSLSRYKPGKNGSLVFLFSDMIHEVNGKKVNPASLQAAHTQAGKDVNYIKNTYNIIPENLKGIKLKYILPYDPSSSTHNPHLDTYWQILFGALGIQCSRVQ